MDKPILIVDDNAMNLKLAKVLLIAAGFAVIIAASADEALQLLDKTEPSLILMDIQMPGMDGLELTRQLRNDPRHRKVPIVALTAYAMETDRTRILEVGCNGYISKPIDTETFSSLVEGFLSYNLQ
jgi:two-component system cell cycle response regulator